MNKQYEILGYPTLLFIVGEVYVSSDCRTTPAEILLKEAARALDGNGYSVMKKGSMERVIVSRILYKSIWKC